MLIDVISIFPEYLAPAELSLLGRARDAGLIQLRVHDLRDWTEDRHRTVDDTPYGGGAGMVMRPEPWGRAIDWVLEAAPPAGSALSGPPRREAQREPSETGAVTLVFPSASGSAFNQAAAEHLATAPRIVFACGRYEGIDARVVEHYRARAGVVVEEFAIGDYVLAGGEVAALVMIEAVTRLVPGVLGNAASLAEESHAQPGLLEYPVYTKPPTWRGIAVPEVLLSGHHARIAEWRRDQARRRTALMRPDLAPNAPWRPPSPPGS
ncbi:MAG: tRNA (guanosine(37)-N1)-methyltransferase TrmD [Bifidobacteriaceae bacterium]|jgi:tRNA (guanine37-N1)-methyltransferase|nr:tRNA (guanosine(37)-N1)-methyltransferase TrmD [Bifidobacteriaceae bacterium]